MSWPSKSLLEFHYQVYHDLFCKERLIDYMLLIRKLQAAYIYFNFEVLLILKKNFLSSSVKVMLIIYLFEFFVGTSGMNHYQESMYNTYSNRLSNVGPMHHSNQAMVKSSQKTLKYNIRTIIIESKFVQ